MARRARDSRGRFKRGGGKKKSGKRSGGKRVCYMMRCTKAGKPSKHGGHRKKVCRKK